jgi:hypothetical protein
MSSPAAAGAIATMAVIFTACFSAGALAHRHAALALLLCGIAMFTLVTAVIAANGRSRRHSGLDHPVCRPQQLPD